MEATILFSVVMFVVTNIFIGFLRPPEPPQQQLSVHTVLLHGQGRALPHHQHFSQETGSEGLSQENSTSQQRRVTKPPSLPNRFYLRETTLPRKHTPPVNASFPISSMSFPNAKPLTFLVIL